MKATLIVPLVMQDLPLTEGVLTPDKDKRICSEYDRCVTPFCDCLFSILDFHLSFNDFEISVLNHLMIAPSQMHRWVA